MNNNPSGNVTVQLYGDYRKVELKPNKGFKIEGYRAELDYYREFRSSGIVIVPDTTYFERNNIAITKPEEIKQPVQESETTQETEIKQVVETSQAGETQEVAQEIEIKPEQEIQNEEPKQEIIKNDEKLSPNSFYTYNFLTRKTAETILLARNIAKEELDHLSTDELKKKVLATNPSID
jgi:hypothetical protein